MKCISCGKTNRRGASFCDQCGTRLTGSVRLEDAERRQLTVMFCDLVDSTQLSQEVDAEDLREIIRSLQTVASDVFGPLGGEVAQYLGDGLLVYFGYPVAHEDDPVRAATAALRLVDRMPTLSADMRARYGVTTDLRIRIGIHTGPVVVGAMGSQEHEELLALGETPNIAARIQAMAQPGAILVSDITRRLVEGRFDLEDLGPRELRGVSEAVCLHRVVRERPMDPPLAWRGAKGLTSFVGREHELASLLSAFRMIGNSHRQVVSIRGEAGIGKSRLLAAFHERLQADPHVWVDGHCSSLLRNSAFHPVIRSLERRLGIRRDAPPAEHMTRLSEALEPIDASDAPSIVLVANFLSLPLPEGTPELSMTPEAQKEKLLSILVRWTLSLGERAPMVLAVEDLHWADPSTLELLGMLLENSEGRGVMLVMTFRPSFDPPWSELEDAHEIQLSPLGTDERHELVGAVAGNMLPRGVQDQVVARTDGVPLYIEEVTRSLLASDVLTEEEHGYQLKGRLEALSIPATLRDSLSARLDRLGSAKSLAQTGAAIGRRFPADLVAAVAEEDSDTVGRDLERLVDAGILVREIGRDQRRYSFRHALIRDELYLSMLKRTRRDRHARIARALIDGLPDFVDLNPEVIAEHLTLAEETSEALQFWVRAAARAQSRAAHIEALGYITRADERLEQLPEDREREAIRLQLLLLKGRSIAATRGLADPEVRDIYARALGMTGRSVEQFQLRSGLWQYYLLRAELDESTELASQLVEDAEKSGDRSLTSVGHRMLGTTLFYSGMPESASRALDHALELMEKEDADPAMRLHGQDSVAVGYIYASMTAFLLGEVTRSNRLRAEAVSRADTLDHPYTRAVISVLAACQAQFVRDADEAQSSAERCLAISRENGFALWSALAVIVRGWARAAIGDVEEGIDLTRQGMSAFQRTGARLGIPYFSSLLAEALMAGDELEDASESLARAQEELEASGERWIEAEIHRLQGEVRRRSGDPETAEACFRRAVEIANHQGARSYELRAAVRLGRLLATQGSGPGAVQLVGPREASFPSSRDSVDLLEARQLLAELR